MNGTQLQYVTLTAYVLLAIVNVTAMRRRAVWPWAAAGLSWAMNSTLFYLSYLVLNDGVLNEWLISWSAITRLHGILLAVGGLLVAARAGGGVDDGVG